jgi:elongation factor Ts
MLENIAKGKLKKFFKENTLINQQFIKDSKLSISQYLKSYSDSVEVTDFSRVGLV